MSGCGSLITYAMLSKDAVMVDHAALKNRILERITPRFRAPNFALNWYWEEPLFGFGGLTAGQMVEAGRGQEVLEYIDAVDAGIYS